MEQESTMVRKYENDFTKENRNEHLKRRSYQRRYIAPFIFSLVLMGLGLLYLLILNAKNNDSHGIFLNLGYTVLFPIFVLSILLFIFSLIGLFKKRTKIWMAFTHIGLAILIIGSGIGGIATSISASYKRPKGQYYRTYTSQYVLLDTIHSDTYQKLLNKEAYPQKERISQIDAELHTWRSEKNIDSIIQKSSPSEEEKQTINEFMVFLNGVKPFVTSYVDTSICLIVDNKETFKNFVKGYYDYNGLFDHLYTVNEFLNSDAQLLNIRPYIFSIEDSNDSKCYEGEVYINFTADYLEDFGASLAVEKPYEADASYLERKNLYFTEGLSNWEQEIVLLNFLDNFYWETSTNNFKRLREETIEYIDNDEKACEYAKKYPDSKKNHYDSLKLKKASAALEYVMFALTIVNGVTSLIFFILLGISMKKTLLNKALKDLTYQARYIDKNINSVDRAIDKDDLVKATTSANTIQDAYITKRKEDIANSKEFVKALSLTEESNFDGGAFQLLGWKILGNLVTIFTLGILYPVKVAWVQGWKINHRNINGKQLHFDGNGFQLLGKYILWWLLCIVTFGIYLIFLPVKIEKWVTSHTHFVNLQEVDEKTKKLLTDNGITEESKFSGRAIHLFGWNILGTLVTLFTLGILYPVRVAWIQGWRVNHQNINGLNMKFDGHGIQLLGKYILWWLLCVVTLGIYLIFLPVRMEKWISKHTHFEKVEVDEEI